MISLISCVFIINVNATSLLSTNEKEVKIGDTFDVNVTLTDVAAWNIHVSAEGPCNRM